MKHTIRPLPFACICGLPTTSERGLKEKNIAVADVSEVIVDNYIQGLDRQCSQSTPNGRLPNSALGLHRLVEVLRQADVLKPAMATDRQSSVEKWLADFDRHLDHVAGCAFGSRDNYLRYGRRLLQDVFGDAEVDWSKLSASTVTDFVRREAAKLRPSACGQPVTAIRSLNPFLGFEGRCARWFAWSGTSGSDVAALIYTKSDLGRRGGARAGGMRCRIGMRAERVGDRVASGAPRASRR
jgi:hypothetical protein